MTGLHGKWSILVDKRLRRRVNKRRQLRVTPKLKRILRRNEQTG